MRLFAAGVSLLALATAASAQQAGPLSQMPFASTPFDGTELLYLAQHGTSFKTTLSSVAQQIWLINPTLPILPNCNGVLVGNGTSTIPVNCTRVLVDPTSAQWAGGADPTGVRDSAPALNAALSVPALSAVVGQGGSGYSVGNLLTPVSVALICSATPTFQVTSVDGSGAVTSVSMSSVISLCANTTAVPATPSTVVHPYFATTGGNGNGAQLDITWAPRNANVVFPCPGTFLINSSVGSVHDNTWIDGGGCAVIKSGVNISNNPNNGGLYASGVNPNIFSNADFVKGNSSLRYHNLIFDMSQTVSGNAFATFSVMSSHINVDHDHFIGALGLGSGPMAVSSHDVHINNNILENYIVATGTWGASSSIWVQNNDFEGHGNARGAIQNNGLGSNAAGFVPLSLTESYMHINHNVVRQYTGNGIDVQGLCQPAQNVCGFMQNVDVSFNDIDTVGFDGIPYGNGDNVSITYNNISNIGHTCILSASPLAGTITSNTKISNNVCKNINTTATPGTSAIQVGNTNDIPVNTIVDSNTILGGGYNFAVQITIGNPQHSSIASATVASGGSGTPAIGDILTLSGGTPVPGIGLSSFTVTGVSGSAVTSVAPLFLGAYSTLPSNPVSTISSGSGTGTTLNVAWTSLGPQNTLFIPGIEDAGTGGIDDVFGTLAPHTAYGAWTFQTNSTFTDPTIGLTIANPIDTKYSQIKFIGAGTTHNYQIGEGGISETTFGVANCMFLFDNNPGTIDFKICADGLFDVLTNLKLPNIPTSAGSGGLYVCIDSTGATYKKASCP